MVGAERESTRPAIGRLLDAAGVRHLGTAFAVSPTYALTAFHCLGARSAGKVEQFCVLLEFPMGRRVRAFYGDGDSGADYALLVLQDSVPPDLAPVPLQGRAFVHESFRCSGYPSPISGPAITSVRGRVRSDDSSIVNGIPAIQLVVEDAAAGASLSGFGGAPVLVGNPEAAIGLVRWNPSRDDAPDHSAGSAIFCCPVRVIAERRPELGERFLPVDYAAKLADLLPLLNQLVGTENERLRQTLNRLEREKLAETQLRGLQADWINIPSWQLALAIGAEPEEVKREFVKTVVRTIARALETLIPQSVAEAQTLLVAKLGIDDETWRLTVWSPDLALMAYLRDHTPPRTTATQWAQEVERLGLGIRHQYAVVEGVLTPIVFQYRPALREVLVTNRNQVNDPDQFLNPHLCKTTSHFLNYLGAFSLREARMPRSVIVFEDVESLFNSGIDQWLAWLYHLVDTGTVFDPKRIYISTKDPEQFRYLYVPETASVKSP